METRVSYTLVGIFVVTLITAFIGGVLWLTTGGRGASADRYLVYITESVSGLTPDALVKFRGVTVGNVRDISIPPDRPDLVRLLLEVKKGTPILQGTVATLEYQGLTGLAFVNLEGGKPGAPPIVAGPGEEYPVIESRPSLVTRLGEKLEDPLEYVIETTRRLTELLSEENIEAFSGLVQNLESLSSSLTALTGEVEKGISSFAAAMEETKKASQGLPALVASTERTVTTVEGMAREFTATGTQAGRAVSDAGREISFQAATLSPELARLISDIRETNRHLKALTEELSREPASILYGKALPRPGPGE